jgi:hypothetical protein
MVITYFSEMYWHMSCWEINKESHLEFFPNEFDLGKFRSDTVMSCVRHNIVVIR